jgi:hypothetical protein
MSRISVIKSNAFHGLSALKKLNLVFLCIAEIEAFAFCDDDDDDNSATALINLSIAENSLRFIANNTFSCLRRLEQLDLSHNLIEFIDLLGFEGLIGLKQLMLTNNHLKQISAELFQYFHALEEMNLNEMDIDSRTFQYEKGNFERLDRLNKEIKLKIYMRSISINGDLEWNDFELLVTYVRPIVNTTLLDAIYYNSLVVKFDFKTTDDEEDNWCFLTLFFIINDLTIDFQQRYISSYFLSKCLNIKIVQRADFKEKIEEYLIMMSIKDDQNKSNGNHSHHITSKLVSD